MRKHFIFPLFVLMAFGQAALAVKAYPYPIEITQPDGSKLTIIKKGDERIKWAQTVDGYSIMRNSSRIYEYAVLDSNSNMVPSGVRAKNQRERSSSDNQFLNKTPKGLTYSKSQVGMMKSISKMYQNGSQLSSQKNSPKTGTRKLICILMAYKDQPFTYSKSDFENLFNQVGYTTDGATGSVFDYYYENSWGQLNLEVTVVGPYTAANNMAYYGANDSDGDDKNPRALISEAVIDADADVNYADFDNDGDGFVDGIYVIFAGHGEEASDNDDEIWSHAWSLYTSVKKDGKIISDYSCSPELRDGDSSTGITRIGVICHEFGHVLGAYDFYDTDYSESGGDFYGTGSWDIMANGSWNNDGATPAHHNPYTKIYSYGWASPTVITSEGSITLSNAEKNSNSFYRINTTTSNEFFLLENRQKQLFDSCIPGHGMIIYHVDDDYITSNESDFNASKHQGMYPVCACATRNPGSTVGSFGSIDSTGCPFPGTVNKISFNDYTIPNSRSWAGENTYKSISDITENTTDKTVSFNISITTDVESNDELVNDHLEQNYPNPFDESTTIDFTIVNAGHVKLSVFNTLGREVATIVDEYLSADTYSRQWIPKELPAGIYFYRLQTDGFKETKRLIKE